MTSRPAIRQKERKYTVMFIPDDNGKPFSLRVSKTIMHSLIFFALIFSLGIAAIILKSGEIGVRLQLMHALREENDRLRADNKKLVTIANGLYSMKRYTVYLKHVAEALGQSGDAAAAQNAAAIKQERLFTEDSLDNFFDDIRQRQSEQYKEFSDVDAAPELLQGSIPNIRPLDGWITRGFGEKTPAAEAHTGIDFAAAQGTPIHATAPGTVDAVVHDKYFGLMVTINHDFGFETRYGHCSQALVAAGDAIERGQTIALVGNTGRSSAPHLHYELLRNGKAVDPQKYMLGQATNP